MTFVRRIGGETFRSLHVRNFRLFFGGQFVSQVGNWLTLLAQTLLVYALTDSGVAIGLLAAAQFGPVLVLGPWAGLVADRSDKRKLLLIVQVVAMVQSFALAALAFSGDPPLVAIYAVAFVGGITVAFDNPARRAFVVEMVPEGDINNAVALNSALMTSSRVIGPLLAGVLVTTVGFGWAFLGDGLSYIAVIVALLAMRPAELRPATVAVRARGQVRAGLRYVRSVPELCIPLVMMTVIGTLAYNFQVVLPLFGTRDIGGDDTTVTNLFAVLSVGSLVGALVAARRTSNGLRTVAFTAMAFGATMSLLAVAPSTAWAYVISVLVGFASITFMTSSTSIVQLRAKPSMRGRVLALQAMVFLGSTPIGGPVVGWIAERYGARFSVLLGGLAALGAGAGGLVFARRRDGQAEPLTPREAEEATIDALAEIDDDLVPEPVAPATRPAA
jgi:MFS family permease